MASNSASKSTKGSSNDPCQMMIEKIADAREDIKLIYEKIKKSFFLQLEELTQKADNISDEKQQVDEKDFKEIEDGVQQIKEKAKSSVPPPQDSSAKTSDASDNKQNNIPIEFEGWPKLDMKLEEILEDAAVKYMYEDYKNLNDGILKNCLLCLAIFPQDATIRKRALIYWWIGEGFVNATATETAEVVGEINFKKLLKGSWIYAVNNRSCPNVREFKMDPWVRWLVIYLAREEEFFNLDKTGMPCSSPSKYRYCLLKNKNEPKESSRGETTIGSSSKGNQEDLIKSSHGKRNNPNQEGLTKGHQKILSVFNVNEERLRAQKLFLTFKEMKSLLVLHLGRWQTPAKCHLDHKDCQTPSCHNDCHINHHIEFEDEESELLECLHKLSLPIHLRYLSFAGISRITELPTAVKKLSHLKILDLRSCQNLEHLGQEIIFLRSLTHLDVSECYMLDNMPKGLGTLSQLEVLKGFIFGSMRSKDPCRLAELAKLKKLRKLSISIGGEAQIQPNEMTKLKDIKCLRSLAITWGKLSQTLPVDDKKKLEENWIELMSFPSDLEKLDLRCFPEKIVWLDPNLKKLKMLYIRGGQVENINIKDEASDLKMDSVEIIRLKFLEKLKGKWSELKKWFPVLNYLEIHKCPNLEDIPEIHNNVWMEEPTEENNGDTAVTSASPSTTDVLANSPPKPSPSECPLVPPPPTADGATTTSGLPTKTLTSISVPTSTSETPKSSSLDTAEVSAPPDIHDRAPSGLAHSTSTTPTSSSLASSAAVDPSVILDNPSCISTNTSTPTTAIPNEDTTLTTNPGTSSSQTPPHPTSSTKDAAHDTPTPTNPSNSLSSLDKGQHVADSTSIIPASSPVAQNNASVSPTMSAHDRDTSAAATDTVVINPTSTSKTPKVSSIDTTEVVSLLDNSSPTTNNTSSSPAPAGLAHNTTTPTSSSLATSATVVPSAIPDNPSSISTNTSTPAPAIQSKDTTPTTPNTSTSQTPPHPSSPTTDASHDAPTPTDAIDPSYSLSSLDKGHDVADNSSITPTSSSPVA